MLSLNQICFSLWKFLSRFVCDCDSSCTCRCDAVVDSEREPLNLVLADPIQQNYDKTLIWGRFLLLNVSVSSEKIAMHIK